MVRGIAGVYPPYAETYNMPNISQQTLVFILDDGKVLLGFKNRGFGNGKWNGYGGKSEDLETMKMCAKRELHEECNLEVEEEDLLHLGFVQFKHGEVIDRRVHIYTCAFSKVNGVLKETDEMSPRWFDVNEVPYDEMWEDARYWTPLVLEQSHFEATFTLGDDGSIKVVHIEL